MNCTNPCNCCKSQNDQVNDGDNNSDGTSGSTSEEPSVITTQPTSGAPISAAADAISGKFDLAASKLIRHIDSDTSSVNKQENASEPEAKESKVTNDPLIANDPVVAKEAEEARNLEKADPKDKSQKNIIKVIVSKCICGGYFERSSSRNKSRKVVGDLSSGELADDEYEISSDLLQSSPCPCPPESRRPVLRSNPSSSSDQVD